MLRIHSVHEHNKRTRLVETQTREGFALTVQSDAPYITVGEGAEDVVVEWPTAREGALDSFLGDSESRTVINSEGVNAGDPSSTGQWNGQSELAYQAGVAIHDTENEELYRRLPQGWADDWLQLSGTFK
ncbi:hypothetical protein SAMN04488556_1391 [Halostagnicola kamekurae]|uniref:Uncharacterized protein n=1 Tax=Halostagnicola kamekurae TaxID=619731 RepID=A0A1I6QN49_9EURY|nr:hypothetical protein SAMN04488556_1391 [Halostagnicola kamekurae]